MQLLILNILCVNSTYYVCIRYYVYWPPSNLCVLFSFIIRIQSVLLISYIVIITALYCTYPTSLFCDCIGLLASQGVSGSDATN